ncbi:hypothetical protein [Roseovarius bejariae]|uniref:hypothetical protein n=1 Tax=Roseovarius bejariae TaxID=2576383 RepID=UPI001562AD65|nr:hypothetical protein [Roseovarius bejariae]
MSFFKGRLWAAFSVLDQRVVGRFSRVGEKPPLRVHGMFHIVAKIELSQRDVTTKPFANLNQA